MKRLYWDVCIVLWHEKCKLFAQAFHLKSDKGLNFVYDKNGDAVDVCFFKSFYF